MDNIDTGIIEYQLKAFLSDNVLGAKNDMDVIQAWITYACSNSEHTLKGYLKELKRFLIYCDSVGIHYAEVKTAHINEYLGILLNPSSDWLKPLNNIVEPKKTQILLRPLGLNSVEYTQRVLNSFYVYLNNINLIPVNPIKYSVKLKVEKRYEEKSVDKALTIDAWYFLSEWLKNQSETVSRSERGKAVRDRWLMHLLYYTGMRKSSVVGLMMDCFTYNQTKSGRVMVINFHMKGGVDHKVVVNDKLKEELVFYRTALDLKPLPTGNESEIAVVPAFKKNGVSIFGAEPISSRGINFVIEKSLSSAANDCEDHFIAEELRNATPHTFRHTCASHQLHYGLDVVATQKHLGHANLNTTMTYLHKDFDESIESAKKWSDAIDKDRDK
ncbi:tyrosine-type recombinase/integrase [Acinetobacter sp. P1(2025)]|uniref:tyrosine-type recombinase/integrase n=1 Tax=Acinetobacter sp. P1(2025) TaxID=3446120 RepID=UPI003F538775